MCVCVCVCVSVCLCDLLLIFVVVVVVAVVCVLCAARKTPCTVQATLDKKHISIRFSKQNLGIVP